MNQPRKDEAVMDNDELSGLPAAIWDCFAAHPTWKRLDDGSVVCAGLECGWKKPPGKGPKAAWQRHQTYTMTRAVADWYTA